MEGGAGRSQPDPFEWVTLCGDPALSATESDDFTLIALSPMRSPKLVLGGQAVPV